MKRQSSLEEISDGRLYTANDMVRADCNGCKGCSSCCRDMGDSVILDPYDLFRLTAQAGFSFEELMNGKIELHVVDGIILPSLSMANGACAFLNQEGRCTIHAHRPGICRLFPLGRYYGSNGPEPDPLSEKLSKERSFRYFLQIHECPMPNRTKIKVEKWIDTPQLRRYEAFICDWHYFLEDVQTRIAHETDDAAVKNINLFLLKLFFIRPYRPDADFYSQFHNRMEHAKEVLEL